MLEYINMSKLNLRKRVKRNPLYESATVPLSRNPLYESATVPLSRNPLYESAKQTISNYNNIGPVKPVTPQYMYMKPQPPTKQIQSFKSLESYKHLFNDRFRKLVGLNKKTSFKTLKKNPDLARKFLIYAKRQNTGHKQNIQNRVQSIILGIGGEKKSNEVDVILNAISNSPKLSAKQKINRKKKLKLIKKMLSKSKNAQNSSDYESINKPRNQNKSGYKTFKNNGDYVEVVRTKPRTVINPGYEATSLYSEPKPTATINQFYSLTGNTREPISGESSSNTITTRSLNTTKTSSTTNNLQTKYIEGIIKGESSNSNYRIYNLGTINNQNPYSDA
jgi:exoribonuclease R